MDNTQLRNIETAMKLLTDSAKHYLIAVNPHRTDIPKDVEELWGRVMDEQHCWRNGNPLYLEVYDKLLELRSAFYLLHFHLEHGK